MTARLRALAIAAILVCGLHCSAQQPDEEQIPCRPQALSFFHRIQDSLRKGDPHQTANLIHYPLRAHIQGKMRLIHTQAEFIQQYPSIFSSVRTAAILRTKDSEVWYRDQGYSVPAGVIWFDRFLPAGKSWSDVATDDCSAGTFGILTVNEAPTMNAATGS